MRERLIRFAGRLYPASWRRRYRVEFEALIEDASRDWRDVLDVLLGAMKMQLTTWTFGKMATAFGVAGAVLWLMEGNIALRRAGRFAFNLEVLDPASLPKHPSFPNRFIIAATGLAGGLLLGALTALVARTRPSKAPAGNSPKSS